MLLIRLPSRLYVAVICGAQEATSPGDFRKIHSMRIPTLRGKQNVLKISPLRICRKENRLSADVDMQSRSRRGDGYSRGDFFALKIHFI